MIITVDKKEKPCIKVHCRNAEIFSSFCRNADDMRNFAAGIFLFRAFAIAALMLCIVFASPALAGGNTDYFAKERYVSPGFNMDLVLSPVSIYGGTLAKGKPLYLSGTGAPDSEIGVWFYKESMGVVDKNRFVKFQTDENGDILGDGVILDNTKSHKLFSGKYYVYIVEGDSEFLSSGYFPDTAHTRPASSTLMCTIISASPRKLR